ncbi:MAG TPA: hypothetical protein EYG68_10225 [Leucothrix mucor]|nr:hypothetical protein [Leucothrix mucor]
MAIVISDAGPLIALARIDALFILQKLFSTIQIPEAVYQECIAKEAVDSQRIQQAIDEGWINPVSVTVKQSFPVSLGAGEIEAMQLALDNEATLLIMDDRLARRQAMVLELNYIGIIRVLYLAEQKLLINNAEVLVQQMVKTGYRVSLQLLKTLKTEDL